MLLRCLLSLLVSFFSLCHANPPLFSGTVESLDEASRSKRRLDLDFLETNEGPYSPFKSFFAEERIDGYAGLGSIQNYTHIADSKPKKSVIFDVNPAVIEMHLIIAEAIKLAPTRQEFGKLLRAPLIEKLTMSLRERYQAHPELRDRLLNWCTLMVKPAPSGGSDVFGLNPATRLQAFIGAMETEIAQSGESFLGNDSRYSIIKSLLENGTITYALGSLSDLSFMTKVSGVLNAEKARRNAIYISNAHEWIYRYKQADKLRDVFSMLGSNGNPIILSSREPLSNTWINLEVSPPDSMLRGARVLNNTSWGGQSWTNVATSAKSFAALIDNFGYSPLCTNLLHHLANADSNKRLAPSEK